MLIARVLLELEFSQQQIICPLVDRTSHLESHVGYYIIIRYYVYRSTVFVRYYVYRSTVFIRYYVSHIQPVTLTPVQ